MWHRAGSIADLKLDVRRRDQVLLARLLHLPCVTNTLSALIPQSHQREPLSGSRHDISVFFPPKYSSDLNPIEQVFAKLKHLLRKSPRARPKSSASHRRNPPSILRPPNAPTISETQAMPNPKSIML
jgi:hypothetical protein